MKILIADQFSASHISNLKAQGFEVHYDEKLNGAALQKAIESFDPHILVVRSTKVTPEHFTAAKSLEAVIRAGSGVENIDQAFANQSGIFVANCPGKNAVAVTELAWGMILATDRKLVDSDRELKQGKWNKGFFSDAKGIKGRTLGIVGYGNIGYEMAVRALAFDMKVITFSLPTPVKIDPRIKLADNVDQVLEVSDVVTIHVPVLPSTKGMVNKEFLQKMKKDATLLNTSRGAIVVEKDLIAHLNANPEFHCGLDVYEDEPKDKAANFTNSLAQHPNVLGTHHIGASTKQAEEAIGQEAYRMIIEYQRTGIMPNCVNIGSGAKTAVLRLKYRNTPTLMESVFAVLAKFNLKVFECSSEVFEGGNTGIAKLKVDENGRLEELEGELKSIKDLMSLKWSS